MRQAGRPKGEPASDTYFFMWNLTESAVRDVESVRAALQKAGAMLRALGGRCTLYVSVGGRYEFVGMAEGIDDAAATKLLQAVNALGVLRTTTFLKTRDFYLDEYDGFSRDVTRLLKVKA